MRLSKIGITLASVLAIVGAAGSASAAPTMELTTLPMSGALRNALKTQRGMTDAQIDDFTMTLAQIAVYDDHQNPTDEARNTTSVAKVYHAAPFFTPSPTRSVVGSDQFADSSLEILDEADDLLESFELAAQEHVRLMSRRKKLTDQIADVDQALAGNLDAAARQSLEQLRPQLARELAAVEQQIRDLIAQGTAGATTIGSALRRSIANSFVLQMSRLGISPTAQEQNLLNSTNPQNWVTGMAQLRVRAGNGQFGLRQVIMESGFTAAQQSVLRTYLELRPDVTVKSLSPTKVFARPTAQTVFDQRGRQVTREASVQIRGVNLGTQGVCGSVRSCNVVIEYTSAGARSVRFSRGGPTEVTPSLVPVAFEADVTVAEPDFVGSIMCDFKTGWTAQGRADIKDGAIIYDGDLTNKIRYDSIDSGFGGCQFNIQQGSKESAFYHILSDMDRFYRKLHMQRQQSSKAEKDAYRASIEAELQQHQANTQRPERGGWFGDVFGMITGGNIIGGIAGWFVGETRDFYWHTTILNTASMDAIHVQQSYNVRNLTTTKRYAFDGFPLVCYAPSGDGLTKVMKACPDAQFEEADTEAALGEDACQETDIFGECLDAESDGVL